MNDAAMAASEKYQEKTRFAFRCHGWVLFVAYSQYSTWALGANGTNTHMGGGHTIDGLYRAHTAAALSVTPTPAREQMTSKLGTSAAAHT